MSNLEIRKQNKNSILISKIQHPNTQLRMVTGMIIPLEKTNIF
jgi:hypothetical protein